MMIYNKLAKLVALLPERFKRYPDLFTVEEVFSDGFKVTIEYEDSGILYHTPTYHLTFGREKKIKLSLFILLNGANEEKTRELCIRYDVGVVVTKNMLDRVEQVINLDDIWEAHYIKYKKQMLSTLLAELKDLKREQQRRQKEYVEKTKLLQARIKRLKSDLRKNKLLSKG